MSHSPEVAALIEKYPSLRKPIETNIESGDGREQALLSFILSHPDLDHIKGFPSRLLSAIDEFSATRDFMISIGGHKSKVISDLVTAENPKIVVELGGYLGYSAILFADILRRGNAENSSLRVWSLEMNAEFAAIARQLIEVVELSDIINVVVGPAEESLRRLRSDGLLEGLDMLFLDHVEALYVSDFKVCEELGLLKEGTVIVADNVIRPGAPDYRKFVREHTGLKSKGVRGLIQPGDIEDELEITHVVQ